MRIIPDKFKAAQDYFDRCYISSEEVLERFNVSKQQQRNLYRDGRCVDALYIGATLCYWRDTAEPWFREYDRKQKERIANADKRKISKEEGSRQKPGRPKKDESSKDAWREIMFKGYSYRIPEEFSTAEKWFNHICNQNALAFIDKLGTPKHKEWLKVRQELKAYLNIQKKVIPT